MKLVQVYKTFGGEKFNMGFSSFAEMLEFWNAALEVHCENYEVVIYTDAEGAAKISGKLNPLATIQVIEFENIDDRYFNIGKFQVHLLQTTPYLMIDIDAILYDIITEISTDVIVEMIRIGFVRGDVRRIYNLNKSYLQLGGIACSGLLGFKNPQTAIDYSIIAINAIKAAKDKLNFVNFDNLFHVEEIGLGNFIVDNNLTISTFTNYVHKQGGAK
jgi:hypothetical protein